MARRLLLALPLTVLVLLGAAACSSRPMASSTDLAAALQAQQADHLPILVALLDQDEPLPMDVGRWIAAEPGRLPRAHVVVLWRDDPASLPISSGTQGSFIARLPPRPGDPQPTRPQPALPASLYPLPRSHAQFADSLAEIAAGLPPAPPPDIRLGEEHLFDALQALMQQGSAPLAAQAQAFSAELEAALRRPLTMGHALLLALGTTLERDRAHLAKLLSLLREQLPQEHETLELQLTLADSLLDAGDITGASAVYARIGAAREEAPVVAAAARSQLAALQVDASTSRRAFEARAAEDVVVLVPDLRSYLLAIAAWTPERFYPVLMQDDRFASRFIAAYHPRQVLVAPASQSQSTSTAAADDAGSDALAPLVRAVLASWGARPGADTGLEEQRRQLASLSIVPDGLVVVDPASPEAAGAVALAAGRFQGLTAIASPRLGMPARPATPADRLERAGALAFAATIDQVLDRWSPPSDAWRFLTLGGRYPFRWLDGEGAERISALDDLLGRSADGERTAVVGRLVGSQAQAVYQAMCSLFLQPSQALLVDTYNQNPFNVYGCCRLAPVRDRLGALMPCMLLAGRTITDVRQRTAPWCTSDLLMITSTGGPDWWTIDGSGTAEDMPDGLPRAMIVDHTCSCADPYDADTIAGRALWGGAYLYFGACAEPQITAFQDATYTGSRLRLGLPWSTVLRTHAGEWGQQPWRLMLVGDPRFALRLHALAREPARFERLAAMALVTPGSGATAVSHLRAARCAGGPAEVRSALTGLDASALDGPGLVLGLESCLVVDELGLAQQLWDAAPADARAGADTLRLARIACLASLDRALADADVDAAEQQLARLLALHPPGNVLERSLIQLGALVSMRHQEEAWAAWLRHQAAAGGEAAVPLQAWSDRTELTRLLQLTTWRDTDADAAVAALVAVARTQRWNDQLGGWLDTACLRWSASSGDGPDHLINAIRRASADVQPLLEALGRLEAQRPFPRDWLILGPFSNGDHGSWEGLESHAGAIDPRARFADQDGTMREWLRPFRAHDFGAIDLVELLGPTPYVHAYAASLVDVASAVDGWLLVGSDDGATVWLDGRQLERISVVRSLQPDQDRLAVHLEPGVHTLLLRIDQASGSWGFTARFARDQDGTQPLAGVSLRSPLTSVQAQAAAEQPIP